MHYNGMIYALIFINNHVFSCLFSMLLEIQPSGDHVDTAKG